MRRPIVGFHQDAEGHWVAKLACGHQQHVRHEPPWMERPWVLTPEGRASRLGAELTCPNCDVLPVEQVVQRIQSLIDRLRGCEHRNDPLRVIQVVNALQPLGKDGALAVIDRYPQPQLPWCGGVRGLFVVIRCLFEVPEPPGYFPVPGLGAPYPDPPGDLRSSPRFPVVLHREIPFVGILGYSLSGRSESLTEHLQPYREFGRVRSQPLHPPDDPLTTIDELVTSPEWPDWGDDNRGKWFAYEQALRLVDPVYRLEELQPDTRLTWDGVQRERDWQAHVTQFKALNARWDPIQNTYVFPNGTFLPPEP